MLLFFLKLSICAAHLRQPGGKVRPCNKLQWPKFKSASQASAPMSEAESERRAESESEAERPAMGVVDGGDLAQEGRRAGKGANANARGDEVSAKDLNMVWHMKNPNRTRKELRKRKHQLQRSVVLAELAASNSLDRAALPNCKLPGMNAASSVEIDVGAAVEQ